MASERDRLTNLARGNWSFIANRSGVKLPPDLGWMPNGSISILGSSTKVEKGEKQNVLTGISYLMPGRSSGVDVCPSSTAACRASCLGLNAGRMGFDRGVRNAQAWKTILRLGAPDIYAGLLRLDIIRHQDKANRLGMKPAVRLDGTSDLGDAFSLSNDFNGIQFYDYTKVGSNVDKLLEGNHPNYHLTFSFSGENMPECIKYLRAGVNVAVPFAGEFPDEWFGHMVINGDISDYRPADPTGCVVGLSVKGGPKVKKNAVNAGWAQ